MSELAQKVALEIHRVSDPVLIALVGSNDPDVSAMAGREAARRMVNERPR